MIGLRTRAGATPASDDSYAGTVVRAGRWGVLSGLAQQLLSVVGTLVVVRILDPGAVGLVALASVLVGVLGVLSQVGIAQALVRRPTEDQRELSSFFWIAALLGSSLGGAAYLAAGPLAAAMGAPDAATLVRILAPAALLQLAASVPRALLQRRMQFGRLYASELSYSLVYVALQIALVLSGAGAVGVVASQTAAAAYSLVLLLALARWRPALQFSTSLVRGEIRFSGGIFAISVLSFACKNVDYLVVGGTAGTAVLGTYYVAYVLPQLLRQRLTWIVGGLLLPVFARMTDDDVRTRRAVGRALSLQVFLGAPAVLGLAAAADPVVTLFFGDRWSAAVAPMRILAVAALFELVTQAMLPLFLARGELRVHIRVEVVRLAVLVVGLTVAGMHGGDPQAVAAVVVVASGGSMCLVLRRGTAAALLPSADLRRCGLSVVAAGAAAGVVFAAASRLDWSPALQLSLLVPLGGAAYAGAAWLLDADHLRRMLRELRLTSSGPRSDRQRPGSADRGAAADGR